MEKLAVSSTFQTHDLEVLSTNYDKAPLLSIDNIAGKFEMLHPIVTENSEHPASCPPPQAITITQKHAGCRLKMINV